MKRRRSSKRRKQEDVQLNLAAMLDMAFQLLAFFILTFRPAPVEGQLAMNLPPPVAMTRVESPPPDAGADDSGGGIPGLDTLHMFVTANSEGDAVEVRLEGNVVSYGPLTAGALTTIYQKLKQVFALPVIPFERVQIAVDNRLRYEELMKLIDVCTKQKLPDGKPLQKVSFTELGGSES